jgi:hypothetical protein
MTIRERQHGVRTNGTVPPSLRLRRDWYQARRAAFSQGFRGRRSRVVLTPRRWRQVARGACRPDRVRQATCPRGDGGKRARSPRRARRTPLKPPRREGRMIRLYLWFCRVHFCCTRTMGASGHPAFPAPSCFTGADEFQNFGRVAPRECKCMFGLPSLRGAFCDEAIQNLFVAPGLLRFARNDDWVAFDDQTKSSSPANAGDPVFQGLQRDAGPARRTGCPAGHDAL